MRTKASLIAAPALALGFVPVASPPAPAVAASPRWDGAERAVVRRINHQRARHGLRRVRRSRALARAADYHSREMVYGNYFAHSSLGGGSFATRIQRFTRAPRVGETLALVPRCRRRTSRRIVSMWMHSRAHRVILLSRRFHRVGVGRRTGDLGSLHGCVVTADFSR